MNYLHKAPIPIEQICFDTAPFAQAYAVSPYSKCEQCHSRIVTTVLVRLFSEYDGERCVTPVHRIALLPCGCMPSMMRQLSPQALAAVALALE